MTKIRRDRHSLYVLAGGYCFRPIFPVGFQHVFKDGSQFKEGDTVSFSHPGGPLATLSQKRSNGRYREKWYSHGAYMGRPDQRKPSSEELFRPEYENW